MDKTNGNTGNYNTGNYNTGNWNTGYWNTGDFNSCNFSAGVFCTTEEKIRIFNMPSDPKATNLQCKTGYSPSGHCGAAYYCDMPYECCAACPEDCNSRCGWI